GAREVSVNVRWKGNAASVTRIDSDDSKGRVEIFPPNNVVVELLKRFGGI
ncbi:hypothetical protein Csa_018648, partial [Cucumis sativus]